MSTITTSKRAGKRRAKKPTRKAGWPTGVWRHPQLRTKTIEVHGEPLAVPISDLSNTILVLSEHPLWKGVIIHDEFREAVMTTRAPPWDAIDKPANAVAGEWADEDTSCAMSWLSRRMHMNVTDRIVDRAIEVVARRRKVHPVRAWLRAQKWDGTKRLDTWLTTYLGVADTAYSRGIGALWPKSAVARVEQPGCQVDYALILESRKETDTKQGERKSSAFRTLAHDPEWFSETAITIGAKDAMENLRGVWIYLLDELDSVRRAENTKTKNFLTCPRDRYRPSYGKRARNFPRQCVFAGTTNEDEYLTDSTGNRRYWPVRVGKIDLAALKRDRSQLWAEAVHRYKADKKWWPDAALERLCREEQAERVLPDDWTDPIHDWCEAHDDGGGVRTVDVLHGAIHLELAEINPQRETVRCAKVLRALGYTRDRVRDGEHDGVKGHAQRWRYVLAPSRANEQAARFVARQVALAAEKEKKKVEREAAKAAKDAAQKAAAQARVTDPVRPVRPAQNDLRSLSTGTGDNDSGSGSSLSEKSSHRSKLVSLVSPPTKTGGAA